MVGALFDTSILIDYLSAIPQARDELARYERQTISIITWMEVLVGAQDDHEAATRDFLRGFEMLDIDAHVAEKAVQLRRGHRIKLPDALIWATAQVHSLLLVTRNSKDFPNDDPGVRMPYLLR